MSNQSKHTPGPWMLRIEKGTREWEYQIRTVAPHNPAGTIGKHVATVNQYLNANDNAYLIAAAPELLESLQGLIQMCDAEPATSIYKAHIDKARAAIAKAEGR